MKKDQNVLGQRGFSLIEIMVAMSLMVLVFLIIPTDNKDTLHSRLEQTVFDFDRTANFAVNEAILRNSIVRIGIDLEKDPMEYFVEYSISSTLALPESKDLSKMSLREREAELKKIEKLNSKFQKVEEFSEKPKTLPLFIKVHSIATGYTKDLIQEGVAYIYFYPTGERDAAVIIMDSGEEMASLTISPFEDRTFDEYYIFSAYELENLDDSSDNKAREIFEKWQKE